ncbi:holin [Alkalihalobacillus alcalophilus ATCC 27647 = CGMCC 1.3604]|nr:phage holin [Alkalihalobacillus alcalophilus]YP_009276860.1 holin [Bacillus phage BalMu-1]AJA42488.1 holin [Bacillus phage BalMu-1]MED1561173.1 phage holin [Alkalihalobacillus alcalophilus]THG88720.1 holin [Alkalihalobacillus alcalophilus ATCC 27647 = CGMCC 1.3604]
MDKGTLIRTIVLILALANQIFAMFGIEKLPLDEAGVTNIVELGYLLFSAVLTIVAAMIAWFKNNYVTKTGKKQKETLKKAGLTKAK